MNKRKCKFKKELHLIQHNNCQIRLINYKIYLILNAKMLKKETKFLINLINYKDEL